MYRERQQQKQEQLLLLLLTASAVLAVAVCSGTSSMLEATDAKLCSHSKNRATVTMSLVW